MSSSVVLERSPASSTANTDLKTKQYKRQRVYIFPTAQGWLYGLMLIVMLLGATNYNNSMGFVMCFLLAGLGLICILHTYRNLTGLIINSKKPGSVFAGQPALLPLHLDNRSGMSRFAILIEQYQGIKWLPKRKKGKQISVSIKAGRQTTVYYPLPTSKRGILKPGQLKISSSFPLGIFNAWACFEADEEYIVYPEPMGSKQLPLTNIEAERAELGEHQGVDDFAGFRKYRPGDPVNSIAWKVFAREQGLQIKQFSGQGKQIILFTWETVSNLNDTELRLSQLCYWIVLADKEGMQYGLQIPNVEIKPAYGSTQRGNCLEQLARYGYKDTA